MGYICLLFYYIRLIFRQSCLLMRWNSFLENFLHWKFSFIINILCCCQPPSQPGMLTILNAFHEETFKGVLSSIASIRLDVCILTALILCVITVHPTLWLKHEKWKKKSCFLYLKNRCKIYAWYIAYLYSVNKNAKTYIIMSHQDFLNTKLTIVPICLFIEKIAHHWILLFLGTFNKQFICIGYQ